ncbi:DUF6265 family protein [Pedobacter sp. NJ-S-72]
MNIQRLFFIVLIMVINTNIYGQAKVNGKLNAKQEFKKLEWLIGNWNRTDVKPGKTATESWVKVAAYEFKGTGVVVKGKDTVFVEKLRLIVKDNDIFYVVDVKENKGLVYFKLTTISSSGFVCENTEHDFPKKIEYQLSGGIFKSDHIRKR